MLEDTLFKVTQGCDAFTFYVMEIVALNFNKNSRNETYERGGSSIKRVIVGIATLNELTLHNQNDKIITCKITFCDVIYYC